MGVAVNQYEVIRECYVPIGPGLRYKRPGNVVTLSDAEAGKLASYIKPVSNSGDSPKRSDSPKRERVAKRNTKPEVVEQPAADDVAEGVTLDAGDPETDNGRTDVASA